MTALPRFSVSNRYARNEESDDALSPKLSSRLNRDDSARNGSSFRSNAAEDDSKLGFATLPDQLNRKAVKKGFNFTVMVVGESGLGKSTLINSLFSGDLYKDRERSTAQESIQKTTEIETRSVELDERGVKLRVTIVDTPGFNDAMNATECWTPIEQYVDNAFEQYFKDECGLNRKNIRDQRVHCCLYFISPYGHGLRPIDVELMNRLQDKVNVVPIIAKADTLTQSELKNIKEKVLSDIEKFKIQIYRMPDVDSDEEDDYKKQDADLKMGIPFAVIGSNIWVESEGRRVRGRQYPWGVVDVDNPKHSDFKRLRLFMLGPHMQELIDMTRDVHYENYRAKYITERMSRRQTDRKSVANKKHDSDPPLEDIVDTDSLLKQKEEELKRMQDLLSKMQAQMGTADS